jgi:hypothetical protein
MGSFIWISNIHSLNLLAVHILSRFASLKGGIGIYGMAVLAYFSYGISAFSLTNCGITILEILRYTVFAILDSKTAVIDKICLRYYGIEYPLMPPQFSMIWTYFVWSGNSILSQSHNRSEPCILIDVNNITKNRIDRTEWSKITKVSVLVIMYFFFVALDRSIIDQLYMMINWIIETI